MAGDTDHVVVDFKGPRAPVTYAPENQHLLIRALGMATGACVPRRRS